jgi:quercetin dioxygenase-like cupin family protein
MTTGASDQLAAEFVLGTAGDADHARAARRLATDPDFRAMVAAWQLRLGALLELAPGLPPAPGALAAIKRRIAMQTAAQAARDDPRPWHDLAPGITCKRVARDAKTGQRSLLLRFAPGAVLPAHPHPHDEACVVLEGAVVSNGVALRAGDYQVIPAGTAHLPVTSTQGALVFVHEAGQPV